MQYSNFVRTTSGLTILFRNEEQITKIQSIKYYTDNASGTFAKKQFRWTFDLENWSSWTTLNQGNFVGINLLYPYIFLEIKYTLSAVDSGTVTSFSFNYTETSSVSECGTPLPEPELPVGVDQLIIKTVTDVIQVTNSEQLGGFPGSYYLDRSNHTGQQGIDTIKNLKATLNQLYTNIDAIVARERLSIYNADSSGSGLVVPYIVDSSIIYLKTLVAGVNILLSETATIIRIDSSLTVDFSTNYINSLPVTKTVGGITYGSTYFDTTKTFPQVMQDMFYTYVDPTVSLQLIPSTVLREYGTAILNAQVIYGWTEGLNSIYPLSYGRLYKNNSLIVDTPYLLSGQSYFYDEPLVEGTTDVKYDMVIRDTYGPEVSTSLSYTFAKRYYWGDLSVSDVNSIVASDILSLSDSSVMLKTDFDANFSLSASKFLIADPYSDSSIVSISDSSFEYINCVGIKTLDVSVNNYNITYKLYLANKSNTGNTTLSIKY